MEARESNLAVIIPYRNRPDNLQRFLDAVPKRLDATYFIIEQRDMGAFNRGKLCNVGFSVARNEFSDFCFHDVDLIPDSGLYYHPGATSPTLIATYVEQFGYEPPPDGHIGGVCLFNKQDFIKINGFSNEHWGWGDEDRNLAFRCKTQGVEINRRPGRFFSLPHTQQTEYSQQLRSRNQGYDLNRAFLADGLTTLGFVVKCILWDGKNVYKYLVDIRNENA